MPGRAAANKTTWSLWIDRELIERFRRAVPRGERQQKVRDAITAIVEAAEAENGSVEEEGGEGRLIATGKPTREAKSRVASNRPAP